MARGHMIYRSAYQPVLLILLSVLQLAHTQSAPQFTRMPTDQIGVQGGVASFVCQATGDPLPKITWSRKGKKVTNQRFEVIEFEDGSGSVLRVQPLRTPRDEAIYECVASNDRGEISASTRLSVLREDQLPTGFPNIDMGPQLKVVERSRTATMLCAASGTPDPEITWFKDFLPIDTHTHGRIKQLRSESFGALQIDQSEETDQGKYECVATNSEGTRYSTPANLYVRVRRIPPRFSVPPMDYEIMPGGSVNISCQAVGVPMPYVKWMLGAEDLTPEDDMPIGRNVLELTDVRQSANYTCVAMSTLGVIETVAQITVKALPNPPGAPVVMERSATSITLMWDSGNPLAVSYYIIQYRPASSTDTFKEIDAIATTRYSVGGLSPYSHYHFRVMAVNSIGRGPPSQTVEARTAEQAPSSPPRRVRGRMLSGSTAMVQWEEPEEANGQVVGYRVYYTSDSSLSVSQWEKEMVRGANFLNVRDLTPNKTYYIRVLAFTAVGDGPLSSDLHIIAKTGVPSQPTEPKAEVKSETSILLSWIPPAHSGTDAITGYELIYRLGDQPEQKISFDPSSSYLLKNLKPFSTYIFQLAARSKHGLGAFTSEITVQTPQTQSTPPPQEVTCISPSSTSLLLSWAPPLTDENGIITGYSVRYVAVERENDPVQRIPNIPSNCFRYRIEGLKKGTLYSVTVSAHTDTGQGPESLPILVRTEEDVPSAPPRGVDVVVLNATSARVSWKPPVAERQHGKIRGYQVTYARRTAGERTVSPRIREHLLREPQAQNDSKQYDLILTDLWPNTEYSVTVAAFTSKGDGARSKPIVIRTKPSLPGLPLLTVSPSEDGTALLKWQPPPAGLSPVLGYRLSYGQADPTSDSFMVQELDAKERTHTVSSLSAGVLYVFRLAARTIWGYGSSAQVTFLTPNVVQTTTDDMVTIPGTTDGQNVSIQETLPLLANLTAENINSSSVILRWERPRSYDRIQGYRVWFAVTYSNGTDIAMESDVSETTVVLNGLRANTEYVARVCVLSKHSPGAYSLPVSIKTQPAQEVFAVNFRVKAAMKSSVLLTWEPRTASNKAQSLIISDGDGESVEVDGRLGQKLVTKLKPQSLYTFLLTSKADGTGGLQHRADAMTAPNLLTKKPQLLDKTNSQSIATLQLPAVQGQANVRGFYIVVVPLKRQRGGNFQNLWSDPDEMNIDELLREINGTGRSVRLRRQAEAKAYISSHFQNLPAEFKLGDGRVYGAFMNRPLVNGQEYVCFVLAILELGQNTVYSTSPFSDAVLFSDVEPQPIVDEEEGLLWVVGPVLAVIFIISIVILILLFKSKPDRKRAELEGRKCSFPSSSKAMSSQHPSDPVELRRINFPTAGLRASIIGYRRLSSMTSHPPVSVSELPAHIERMKANDNLRFSQEYESIDPGQQFSWEQSNLEINKSKNRYANVIAYDHTRVSLSNNDGVPGGDYINANFIDGYRRQGAYIATQGPMPDTFSDFWRMVWEQHTANIIMITKLEEKSRMPSYFFSKNKCDQYWPSRGTETYGLVQVSLLDTVELATYCVRTFALFKSGSGEKREVRQFQFTAWPDQGVPEHPTPFLAFLRRVKACNPPDAGPIAVHCSAGVGRTGCFIVIDAMLERVKQEKAIDVYGHVTLMRSQRNYMVQTEEQYIFIYDALLEAVSCGNTEVPARNLYAYIQRLSQTEPPEHISGMEQEFKRLANAKAHNSRFVSASLPCNKFKNRLVNIMPYETTRVCLQPIRGVEGSDYVNGSFIDGYRQQRAYIGTQGPLAETVEDYWRMLWEHNSTIVVMLTKLREMGREKCHQYWPSDRSARYQYFVVDPMAEYNMPQYILREFKVTDARDGQSRTVRQFQFTDWPEQGVPKSGEGFIDFIGQVHKTKEQFGQDGPISVHCSAGVGRTGVFITLSIVLERMRYEGVVDIFQTVKMLRTQRPAMVQTEEQYQFCYRAALEYLGSFDHYAT
ncbi:protein tyrosine phosphatase receptor type Db isoform X3 [Rhinichthys klamathensis goyatoka]|uniref:protein tyrosine phosphatase receptor type Db isoform X3 n=1 Tax=Rhinichthys klamathensis goyatoka TaxID=3034132 RepID=UPI0024B5F11E|nr:protein tyrosine phosphatase receptor type Db isoform X3 [Rhinichthys klamathensis goyatoka]